MSATNANSGNRTLIIGSENVVRGFNFSNYREVKAGATIASAAALSLSPSSGLTAGTAVIQNDQALWTAQSANGTSAEFVLSTITPITLLGTFGGATVTLQLSTDGGTTWLDYTTYTAPTCVNINLPTGMMGRLVLSGASGTTSIYATVELGNTVTYPMTPTTAGTYTAKCVATLDNGKKIVMKGNFIVVA